jgi:hypothetical protein
VAPLELSAVAKRVLAVYERALADRRLREARGLE